MESEKWLTNWKPLTPVFLGRKKINDLPKKHNHKPAIIKQRTQRTSTCKDRVKEP